VQAHELSKEVDRGRTSEALAQKRGQQPQYPYQKAGHEHRCGLRPAHRAASITRNDRQDVGQQDGQKPQREPGLRPESRGHASDEPDRCQSRSRQ